MVPVMSVSLSRSRLRRFVAGAGSVALVGSLLTVSASTAFAVQGPNPFMSATVTKVEDGTGHGSAAQTFVNSANGFSPGDDTPTDGVVSSNDYVTYEVNVSISAAAARTVELKMTTPSHLDPEGFARFCRAMTALKTTVIDNNTCRVTVPAGVTAQLSGSAVLKALDTAGTVKADQVVSLSTGLVGAVAYGESKAAAVTVVSAPAADVWFKDWVRPAWAGDISGAFPIEVYALGYPGFSPTKGGTTATAWSAKVDVSQWPSETTWSMGGTALTPVNGQLSLTNKTGNQSLAFTLPASATGLGPGEGRFYDVRLIVDPTSFSTPSYKNNGTGWQPGDGKSAEFDTFNAGVGSRTGVIYPNNDFSRAYIQQPLPLPPSVWDKYIKTPSKANRTIFDDGNRLWSAADPGPAWRFSDDEQFQPVSVGTQFEQRL